MPSVVTSFGPAHFINRELSWLEFNQRVLDEALNPQTPLLERLKFFCIVGSNLDEFFEVRVAGLKQEIDANVAQRSNDGLTPRETLRAVRQRVHALVDQQYACWRDALVPGLARNGIRFLDPETLSEADQRWLEAYYRAEVHQVLTPLRLGPAHPFPRLTNKSINLLVELEMTRDGESARHMAVVQVPRGLPRLIQLPRPGAQRDYVFLGKLIGHFLSEIYPGTRILGYWVFRLTRNSELYIDEEEVDNLLKAVETEVHNRRRGEAVRLELEAGCPEATRDALLKEMHKVDTDEHLTAEDLFAIDGPLNPTRLVALCEGDHLAELRDPPFHAPLAAALRHQPDLFAAVRKQDLLLHHPYESFGGVVEFLQQAASDPKVLAIKQTLYRTGGDPRVVGALTEAVNNGKHVTAVVELRARFDEANNILWARRLEEEGVHVVYGLVGYKIHAKLTLVVRRDEDGLRRYLHLGTGNYNPTTARIYTDLSLLTCAPALCEDATLLFNLLTGVCQFQGTRQLVVAPFDLHRRTLELIEREAGHARQGVPARIIAKMNSLVDREVIEALYRASQAGVAIDLIVRGICCLRPQLPGVSDRITVRSIVDRFLEHSRVFYFENGCQPEVFIGSADWMPRNFQRRIEVMVPIADGRLRERLRHELQEVILADNVKARILRPDGSYAIPPLAPKKPRRRSQEELLAAAQGAAEEPRAGRPRAKGYPQVRTRQRPDAKR